MDEWVSPCKCMTLRLGRWQDVLADVTECDAVITDPPYSVRTHRGERSLIQRKAEYGDAGPSLPKANITYQALSQDEADELALAWHKRSRWVFIFGDVQSWAVHEAAWAKIGWVTFAPVVWVKENPPPRFSGDGPTSSCEYVLVARPRKRVNCGSLPGHYRALTQTGRGGSAMGLVGSKDPVAMREVISDYSRPGDLIVDPYAGSGTTLLAAAIEGRRCIGAEMDPKTYDLAVGRLSKGYTPRLVMPDKPKPKQEKLL